MASIRRRSSHAKPRHPGGRPVHNRSIATLRATIPSRLLAERADAIHRLLDHAMSDGRPGPVSSREIQGVNVILVGDRRAFAILPLDVDTLAGETAAEKTAETCTYSSTGAG